MRFVTAIAAAALAAFVATLANAQQDPIAAREAYMKANGRHAGVITKMAKGESPYDATAVKAAFDQWDETAQKFPALFPENSKDGETRALPAIWSERAKFEAAVAKFKKDVDDNRSNAMSGLDGLKIAFGAVGKNCGSCHETFRKPR